MNKGRSRAGRNAGPSVSRYLPIFQFETRSNPEPKGQLSRTALVVASSQSSAIVIAFTRRPATQPGFQFHHWSPLSRPLRRDAGWVLGIAVQAGGDMYTVGFPGATPTVCHHGQYSIRRRCSPVIESWASHDRVLHTRRDFRGSWSHASNMTRHICHSGIRT